MMERIRDNGIRDKFYNAPRNGPTFKRKRKKKRALNQPWKLIAVEKVKAEDLPQGWIGEIRVREKDQVIRRDLSAEWQPVARRTRSQISFGQSSAMNVPIEYHRRHDNSSSPSLFGSDYGSEQIPLKDEKSVEALKGKRKSRTKKAPEMPRRSKRLAGIEVDPVGLKPKTRARRRDSARDSDNCLAASEKHTADEKLQAPLGTPLGEMLSDPCIAFAIKILTGTTTSSYDNSSAANLALDLFDSAKMDDRMDDAKRGQNDTLSDETNSTSVRYDDHQCRANLSSLKLCGDDDDSELGNQN